MSKDMLCDLAAAANAQNGAVSILLKNCLERSSMDWLAPLIQTVLWVCLFAAILFLYHRPLGSLLEAIRKRVESGGAIKVGPVEMAELRPQPPQEQLKKLNSEIAEIVSAEKKNGAQPVPTDVLRARYLSAEDFALREIQTEFGTPVGRQILIGADNGVDGFFVWHGRVFVVEVKLLGKLYMTTLLGIAIDRIRLQIERVSWRNAEIILAAVFNSDEIDLDDERKRIEDGISPRKGVTVRCYRLSALAKKYGAENT